MVTSTSEAATQKHFWTRHLRTIKRTKSFYIQQMDLQALAAIMIKYGTANVLSVTYAHDTDRFLVRVHEPRGLVDYVVSVSSTAVVTAEAEQLVMANRQAKA